MADEASAKPREIEAGTSKEKVALPEVSCVWRALFWTSLKGSCFGEPLSGDAFDALMRVLARRRAEDDLDAELLLVADHVIKALLIAPVLFPHAVRHARRDARARAVEDGAHPGGLLTMNSPRTSRVSPTPPTPLPYPSSSRWART